jgi:hypothetical protein
MYPPINNAGPARSANDDHSRRHRYDFDVRGYRRKLPRTNVNIVGVSSLKYISTIHLIHNSCEDFAAEF